MIVQGGRRHTEDKTEHTPNELQHQVMRADLSHARTVKHHQPQRQQGGDANRQSCDGDFHFNISTASRCLFGGYCPPGVPAGAGVVTGALAGMAGAGAATGAGAAASAFAGMVSFCPTLIWSVVRLLAALIALTVVPCAFAILVSVSPDFTV